MANTEKPDYLTKLEAAYGAPSRDGFGSTVFYEVLNESWPLEKAALEKYKYFVDDLWARFGETAWTSPWKEVFARPSGVRPDIVAELRSIKDPDAMRSVPMILDDIQNAAQARVALSNAFDNPAVTEVRAFNLGDGEQMSGILVAGRRASTGGATFLVFLMD